jgi:hypothetical protein
LEVEVEVEELSSFKSERPWPPREAASRTSSVGRLAKFPGFVDAILFDLKVCCWGESFGFGR